MKPDSNCRVRPENKRKVETPRLLLCEMTQNDVPELCSMLQDDEVMYAWEHSFSTEEVRSWISRNIVRYQEYGYGYWLAFDKTSGETVGQIGLIPEEIEGGLHLGIGWILRKKYWGKGYAAEGGKACLDYAFHQLNAGRVIADIRPMNRSSIRVAERIGMTPMGTYDKNVGGKIMTHRLYYARTPKVTVSDYDPVWTEQFAGMKRLLFPVLLKFGGMLEHVGSTSVPGLAAKPVIDADYILSDASLMPQVKTELEALGFFHRGDGGLPGREMFTETLKLDFRHNFYVCAPGCVPVENHIRLRSYLRLHRDAATRYGALKKQLAAQFPGDVESYCAGKSDLISEFLAAAGMDATEVSAINNLNKNIPWQTGRSAAE